MAMRPAMSDIDGAPGKIVRLRDRLRYREERNGHYRMSRLDATNARRQTVEMTEEEWRLARGRRRYETIGMAAKRLGYEQASLKRAFQRIGVTPDDHLDDRTPVYLVANVDAAMAARPGRGARGVARKQHGPRGDAT